MVEFKSGQDLEHFSCYFILFYSNNMTFQHYLFVRYGIGAKIQLSNKQSMKYVLYMYFY